MLKLLLAYIFLSITFFSPVNSNASIVLGPDLNNNKETQNSHAYSKIPVGVLLKLSPRQISKLTGKKLSLGEKLGLFILKHRMKRTGCPSSKRARQWQDGIHSWP